MAGFKTALKIAILPFRAIWFVVLVGNFLVVATVCLMRGCFIAYGVLLAFSYALLPAEWTHAIWRAAARLYVESGWFKSAVITSFTLCCLPILKVWPGKPPGETSEREREIMRLHVVTIAARQQDERLARVRANQVSPLGCAVERWSESGAVPLD